MEDHSAATTSTADASTPETSSFSPSHLATRFKNLVTGHSPMFNHREQTQQQRNFSASRGLQANAFAEQIRKRDDMIVQLRKQVVLKDEQIAYLASELDKYQSVFNQKPSALTLPRSCCRKLDPAMESDGAPRKRAIGISAEPQALRMNEKEHPKHYPKTAKTREILNQAILENDFMKNMDTAQVVEIVECMYSINFATGNTIIREGELGSVVYVMEEGVVEVSKDCHPLRQITRPSVFGELAILYNCMRTATVKAMTPCALWAIDRKSFQAVMMKTGILKHQRHLEFLKSVPSFASLSPETLAKFVDLLDEVHYEPGEYVIRQGARGDTFYIISNGQVQVTQNEKRKNDGAPATSLGRDAKENFVRLMGRGEWFGEKALKNEDVRTANIIATYPNGVDCLVLDRESYELLIGDLESLDRHYPDEEVHKSHIDKPQHADEFKTLGLHDLCSISTLGVGGFGRVDLVKIGKDASRTFALKRMKKQHIVQTKQEQHVMNERTILLTCNSEFIVKLHKTFKDKKYLYMLLEACLGGELWTILRNNISFNEAATQFYVACVVEALNYLHERGIIYRDLKPENLLVDQFGYCKMTDFGFAKKIGFGRKTWTFCGTPEYVAPEIILNKGHDFSADTWSLGILIYELMIGTPPFTSDEPMKTYNIILRGIDAVEFPRKITKNTLNLIKKLCRDNPTERFGYGKGGLRELKKHVWFEGFDWVGLKMRRLKPPHVPRIASAVDVSNFDSYSADLEDPPDDTSGWDREF